MPDNDFLTFALGPDENILNQADYADLEARLTGWPKGKLASNEINKALRQSAFVASALAQLIVDTLALDALDNGNRSAFVTKLANAITAIAVRTSGAMIYQGTWNANTNTPALASGVGTKGFLYTVSVAGATNLDGINVWSIGDKAVFNGVAWEKIEGQATEVLSVAGRVANVVLAAADITDSGAAGRQILQTATITAIRALLGPTVQADGNVNHDLVAGDLWNYTRMTSAADCTVTVRPDATYSPAVNSEAHFIQAGAGVLTFVAGVGVTINATPSLDVRAQFSAATLKKVGANEYDLIGDLAP